MTRFRLHLNPNPHLNLNLPVTRPGRKAIKIKMRIRIKTTFALAIALAIQNAPAAEPVPSTAQLEFFEKRIRPVLADSCYSCHSAASGKAKGGLRLDSREGVRKGGDSGPAVVPGKPDESLLIKAVRYSDKELQMPPAKNGGKLSPEKLADLESWVMMGAPDPRPNSAAISKASGEADLTNARQHWAFKPVTAPTVPAVKAKAWIQTPVDAFVLARLDEKNLQPAPPADRRTLLRRVYFDLIGLPPTPGEMAAFLADGSPDSLAKVVDQLLSSPRYGERWGRYWLDVARYADTKGYVFQEERRYPFSYTYRDYVICALNDDKPIDRFLLEQIAGDRLVTEQDKSSLAALGFLTLGRRFLNNENDIIDDRIDVVMRGTQGLTVGCARCHDHKFDPIPSTDYYALHGIFASSHEPAEKPLLGALRETDDYRAFLAKKAGIEAKIEAKAREEVDAFLAKERGNSGDYLIAAHDAPLRRKDASLETFAGERKIQPAILGRWINLLDDPATTNDAVLGAWIAFTKLSATNFATQAAELMARQFKGSNIATNINPLVLAAFTNAPPTSLKDVANRYEEVFKATEKAWTDALANAKKNKVAPPTALADANREAMRRWLQGELAPSALPFAEARQIIERHIDNQTVGLRQEIEALNWTHPGAPARAMALLDNSKPRNSRVFIRGNPGNHGAEVPRRFPAVLANEPRAFTNGSGRLELARTIASRDNPLTARVFVNRVWGWHFGTPLVRTPSDFGVRTEAPAQLDLLNWLAATFMDQEWSLKKLHRAIVLSSTYQQSSDPMPRNVAADPDNALLHHHPRQRLDFEALRDTLLAASGSLDATTGGQPVDILAEPFSGRRTIYGFIDRQNLPGLFRTFDFANPDVSSPGRFRTTVPQQALFLMNSPFVEQQARRLANRPEIATAAGDDAKLTALHQLLFQRTPTADELRLARAFLRMQPASAHRSQPAWQYGAGLYDASTARITNFRRFTNFSANTGWHPDKDFPSKQSGWVCVGGGGGHPGATPALASVRRWTAPIAGTIVIEGTLQHDSKEGDGVRGRIVSSRGGLLGEWSAHHGSKPVSVARLEVSAGETIDFAVDCVGSEGFDSYAWAPVVRYSAGDLDALTQTEFRADKDFSGPAGGKSPAPLSAWEQYAQVLLLSNELAFVD